MAIFRTAMACNRWVREAPASRCRPNALAPATNPANTGAGAGQPVPASETFFNILAPGVV
jgi:hypothetical protein